MKEIEIPNEINGILESLNNYIKVNDIETDVDKIHT